MTSETARTLAHGLVGLVRFVCEDWVSRDDRPPREQLVHEVAELFGARFDAIAAGPEDGRPVLLLHGFPEAAIAWRYQVAALGERGFRAVAVDQRGEDVDALVASTVRQRAAQGRRAQRDRSGVAA